MLSCIVVDLVDGVLVFYACVVLLLEISATDFVVCLVEDAWLGCENVDVFVRDK